MSWVGMEEVGFGSLDVVKVDSIVTGIGRRVGWAGHHLGWA